MNIVNIDQAIAELQKYVPAVARYSGDDMTLDRMWPLLSAVGNPHKKLKTIHIAGTSGKTSTSYYIAALLKASGQRTGMTVSPHVDSITERLQIDGSPVSDDLFCSYLSEFLDLITDVDPQPSYFELMIAFVLWVFARENLDYVVLETGMGGLFDGTNVVTRSDKICVITDIGLDHTQILGNNVEQIAAQKAGIIHKGNHVFTYKQ